MDENERTQLESEVVQAGIEPAQRDVPRQLMAAGACERVRVLRELMASAHLPGYGKRQAAAAEKLGITVRSVRRLVRQLREGGIGSVVRRSRSDRGLRRISQEWQKFIVETYREGNRGSRRMSPAQVAVRVKVQAQELGTQNYPSHMSVYRILKPLIETSLK